MRLRKRENLPKESEFRDSKYDSAFVDSLMSDDEDELDENKAFTGRYVSYPPAYRSAKVRIELASKQY